MTNRKFKNIYPLDIQINDKWIIEKKTSIKKLTESSNSVSSSSASASASTEKHRFSNKINKNDGIVSNLKTDSLETIERAMDIQRILYEISQSVNSYYKFQLFIVILTAFIIIVFDTYYLFELFKGPAKAFRLSRVESVIYLCYQLFTNSANVLGLVTACSLLQNAAQETGFIVHKILAITNDRLLRERLMHFSLQLNFNKPEFTAFGLFTIDGSLIYAIAGATTTYLVILLQYSNPMDKLEELEKQHHHFHHFNLTKVHHVIGQQVTESSISN